MKKVIVILAIIIVVPVAYYLISPIFRTVEVHDELPPTSENKISADKDKVMPDNNKEKQGTASDVMETMKTKGFEITGTGGHPAQGTARVIKSNGQTIVRFENFKTIDGPNLHVYLTKDLNAKEFVDLGPIKGTQGDINYEVPEGVDVAQYKYVIHWCVPFRVLFNYAQIN